MICVCLLFYFFLTPFIIEGVVLGNILEIKPNLWMLVVFVFIPSTISCMSASEISGVYNNGHKFPWVE